mgnify:FL=1
MGPAMGRGFTAAMSAIDEEHDLEPLAAPAPPSAAPADPLEAEFQAVYHDFIDTRERCGEPTEGVTFEKFSARLRDQRQQLMSRYNCKTVKFTVYVKDGKAALKATPLQG